jgi:hypothetical protein
MKHYKFSLLSFICSDICIIGLIIFNYYLAQAYLSTTGKTRALFLQELIWLHIKFYFIPFAIAALIFSIRSYQRKEIKWLSYASSLWFLIAAATFFIRLWRFMI